MDEIKTEVVTDKYRDDDTSDAFSDLQGTILWPRRPYLYRISFLTLVPMFALFLLGFSCPFWMKKHDVGKYRGYYNKVDMVDVSIGLWRVCEGLDFTEITDCTPLPETTKYDMACQAMLCLCLIFTFFSITFGLYENFATRYDIDDAEDPRTRRPEVNAIVSGIFGMIGVSMYGALIIGVAKNGQGGVQWAFPLTACAVTGITICGILMAISNPIHNSAPLGYPGQPMAHSRQSMAHSRELGMQDRLVSSNGLASPLSNNGGAVTYGLTGEDANATEMTLLQRSDSFMSSHMSSPDIYSSTTGRSGDYNQRTHVVETYDLHTRPTDTARRQALKKHLESKSGQRRSWHFDDRSGAYVVSDLIDAPLDAPNAKPAQRRGPNETETIKPPVPPRRDKMSPSQLKTISDDVEDLMLLEDPVVTGPNTPTKKKQLEKPKVPDRKPSFKKNANPFLEDYEPVPQRGGDMTQSVLSNDGWENQPWPDPPSESEMLGDSISYRRDKDIFHDQSSTDSSVLTTSSQSNAVPESLQYQPQNSGSLSRTSPSKKGPDKQRAKPLDNGFHESMTSSKEEHKNRPESSAVRDQRKDYANQIANDNRVPILQEYDNPLFKRQALNNNRQVNDAGAKIYDSTSFIHPSPSPPQQHYAANTIDPSRRHSSHFPQRTNQDDNYRQSPKQFYNGSPDQMGGPHQGSGNPHAPDVQKRNSFKEKPKVSEKPNLKSRPRQIKREHNQRRTGHESPGMPPTIPSPGFSTSNPDLSRKSPKMSRPHRNESMGRADGRVYATPNVPYPHHPPKVQPPAYNEVARPPPPYTSHPSYPHWGDSDL